MRAFDVPYYLDFLPPTLLTRLDAEAAPVEGVPGLKRAPSLTGAFPGYETPEALGFVVELYEAVKGELAAVLSRRAVDRAFVDARTRALVDRNAGVDFRSPAYATVLGERDERGEVVVGPVPRPAGLRPVDIPPFLRGEQVTLFGPPDSEKLSINAMNALHRRLPGEAPIVAELVEASGQVPRWGADNEDSKTPLMADLLRASVNLKGCFDGTLRFEDAGRGRVYELADAGLARPIKRIAGLALPDGSHLYRGNPLPLHLYDFALHLWHNHARKEALVFYVPKLETPAEAAYLKALITAGEEGIRRRHPSYEPGAVRLFIVFENPRAIFRIQEIADVLHPHFVGGSLGWHDFLASTARLFKEDPHYRIPVKADPNIVINHIKESHLILAKAMDPIGGIKIGGMYGILYEDGNAHSFEVSMVGYVKDVVTQLKRGLDGFWVAHPDFVRVGIALVEAFRRAQRGEGDGALRALVAALVPSEAERAPLWAFIEGEDVPGLSEADPLYPRGVLAADVAMSEVISNDDPEEVRYNVFQAVQYLADWLSGNGCVALPATLRDAAGRPVFVRIMDDLATTERSRWELWAEIHHGRVSVEAFEAILAEELDFIRADRISETRRVQVRWEGEAARWYPVAVRLLRQLVTSPEPPEFVTELTLPFTLDPIRLAADPWAAATALCPGRYRG